MDGGIMEIKRFCFLDFFHLIIVICLVSNYEEKFEKWILEMDFFFVKIIILKLALFRLQIHSFWRKEGVKISKIVEILGSKGG